MRASAGGDSWGRSPAGPWLGDANHHLAGLTPTYASLHGLTRSPSADLWYSLRRDPAAVLLLVRDGHGVELRADNLAASLAAPDLLAAALLVLARADLPFLDVTGPDRAPVYHAALLLAERAETLACATLGRVDPVRAWIAGLFAPLGHLLGGRDPEALVRRLALRWGLPAWLADTLGRLRLTADIAADLGVARGLFEVVQQAALDTARQGHDLGLVAVDPAEVGTPTPRSVSDWRDPRTEPLLPELLRLALDNRLLTAGSRPPLEDENERLHLALVNRLADEGEQARTARLAAVAELAAGAGHEINNPLAIISGQAQYLLSRRERLFVPESAGKVVEALESIVGQTKRIHTLLRQLLQFARPPAPVRRSYDLALLAGEVVRALDDLAVQRRVRVEIVPTTATLLLHVDPEQLRTALTALVRNAIEAAPADGWVRVGTRQPGAACPVEVVVEDSGPGPLPEQVPYLFDPFFSGRAAGRGKGLGLPVAWQLIRQHGGEIRYVRPEAGPTRFIVRLPATPATGDRAGEAA